MSWSLIVYSGIITFFSRSLTIVLLKKDTFNKKTKLILSYVPSAIFPAIIFPAVFLDDYGSFYFENNPKMIAAFIAIMVGYFTKNIIITIISGLIFYWILIFFLGY